MKDSPKQLEVETSSSQEKQEELKPSAQRFTPGMEGRIYYEHLHRYAVAAQLVKGTRVLDIACGEGYGSRLLATHAKHVVGIDISEETIRHANDTYARDNLEFKTGNCFAIPLPDQSVDFVVCFETLEHIEDHVEFIVELKRVLAKGGRLLISSPDRFHYNQGREQPNPHHVRELSHGEFIRLLKLHFKHVTTAMQTMVAGSVILPADIGQTRKYKTGMFLGDLKQTTFDSEFKHGEFSLALCSELSPPRMPTGVFHNIRHSNIVWNLAETFKQRRAEYELQIEHQAKTLEERAEWARGLDEEINRMRVELADKEGQIKEARAFAEGIRKKYETQIEHQAKTLEERSEWARGLDEEINRMRVELADREDQIKEARTFAEGVRKEYETQIEHQAKTLEERSEWARGLDEESENLRRQINSTNERLNVALHRVEELIEEKNTLKQNELSLTERILRADDSLRQAKQQNLAQQKDLDHQHGITKKLTEEFEERTGWALSLDSELRSLRTVLEQTKTQHEQEVSKRRALQRRLHYRLFEPVEKCLRFMGRPLVFLLRVFSYAPGVDIEVPPQLNGRNPGTGWSFSGTLQKKGMEMPPKLRICVGRANWSVKTEKHGDTPNDLFHFSADLRLGKGLKFVRLEEMPYPGAAPVLLAAFWIKNPAGTKNPASFRPKRPKPPSQAKETGSASLSLPICEKPDVSIVIPIHNQLEYTIQCLASLIANTEGVDFEVIIGNDRSDDSVIAELKKIRGLRICDNHDTQGFLNNCNSATAHAKGRFIFFLNNDTEVQKNWLKPLLKVFEERDDAGIVGCKLIYPDGSLQEAGGIIWKDGSGWNYGRNDEPEKPEYNYLRETDYISGAALMIRRDLFNELGRFSLEYTPAYYEDTDLAFKVRQFGRKVYYQPQSIVVHHEGKSCGTDIGGDGHKKHQVVNAGKFFNRWQSTLEALHYPNGKNVFRARERSMSKKTMLVIDHYVPHIDQDAGSRSTWHYIQLFQKLGLQVKFIGDNFYPHEPYTDILQQAGVEVLYGNWYCQNIYSWMYDHADNIDYIFTNRSHITIKYLKTFAAMPHTRVLYYGHDLGSLSASRRFALTKDPVDAEAAEEQRSMENEIWEAVDVIYYPSHVETEEVLKRCPEARAYTLPLNIYEPLANHYSSTLDQRKDLIFVGGFGHPPNEDAVLWFLDNCWPEIEQALPEARFLCVGSRPTESVKARQSKRIIVTGWVSDEKLEEIYQQARLAVIPLRYGAGIKGKVIEALWHSVPVAMSTIAAEGLPGVEKCSLIEDSPDGLSAKIPVLYNDEAELQRMAEQCGHYIRRHFSESAAAAVIKEGLGAEG